MDRILTESAESKRQSTVLGSVRPQYLKQRRRGIPEDAIQLSFETLCTRRE